MSPALQRPLSALAAVLLLAVGLPGCAVVSVAGTAIGVASSVGSAAVSVGSAAVSVGSTVVSTTAKVAGEAVGASTTAAPGTPVPP
jgi:hypothetical protein